MVLKACFPGTTVLIGVHHPVLCSTLPRPLEQSLVSELQSEKVEKKIETELFRENRDVLWEVGSRRSRTCMWQGSSGCVIQW